MLIKKIIYPSYLDKIKDIECDNIDVCVTLENGFTYNLIVGTPRNIEFLMDRDKKNYFGPGYPFIIVKKLNKEIIRQAIQAFLIDEAHWIRLHHFAGDINTDTFTKLEAENTIDLKGLDEFLNF